MPKAESTDNLLTRKLSASVTGEQIFAGSKKTRKSDNSPVYLKKILALSLVVMAVAQVLAEPTGGQVVKGQAQINQTGASGATTTTIKQSTPQVSINWQSFNVGEKERVNFVQPDASSLAINRILGSQGSSIQGNINANGQVWLINPNGIVFGKNAQVNVGGLVATTLDTANPGSLTGTQRFSGNSTAAVTNSGLLNASDGGYVTLLGHRLSNQGEINAPAGTVAMGAGSAVDLQFNNNQLLGLQVYESLLDAMSENGGVIRADAGQVLLKAGAQGSLLRSAVNNTGVIQARTVRKQGGKIVLVSGMKTGNTKIDGKLDASAPETGDGGFIETSGHTVQLADTANISTKSAQGKTGEWLIDPDDFVVAASGGNITGANLGNMLNSTSVIIETTNGPATLNYANSGAAINGNGDIQINDRVAWSSNNMLTLKAYRNININAPISASGVNGNLQLYYGQGSTYGVINGVTASYKINAPVSLQSGYTFSTQLGSSGPTYNYWVITSLGSWEDFKITSSATNSLQAMARTTNLNNYYALGADIDANSTAVWNSGKGFTPIGNRSNSFNGKFEGLGHKIDGLYINNNTRKYLGLFGSTGLDSVISNLQLTNINVTGNQEGIGGLVGQGLGNIFNVKIDGNVTGNLFVGGLVGLIPSMAGASGAINNSSFSGHVTGRQGIGGIAGHIDQYASVNFSSFNGQLTGTQDMGGLVGINFGTVQNNYATTTFSSLGAGFNTVGGLVGLNSGTLKNSYANVNMDSPVGFDLGGLAGQNLNGGVISDNYAMGSIKGHDTIGGITASSDGDVHHNFVQMNLQAYAPSASADPLTSPSWLGSFYENYYDRSKNPTQSYGTEGLSANQMLHASNFTGFDFTNTWFIYEGKTTPLLRSFLTPLNVTVSVSGSKTYDGTTACVSITCQYTLDTASLIAGKQLLGTGLISLSSKNAGAVKGDLDLYSDQQGYLINTTYTGLANINKADLTVTASQATKTYDGTLNAPGTGSVGDIAGAGAGETVKRKGKQVYLDKNAGNNKTVRASGVTIKDTGGADVSANYNINYVDNTSSVIDKADLTVTATQTTKTYDGTTNAPGTGSVGDIAGAGAGESVKTAGSQAYVDKNAGNNKTVRASGVTIKDSGNADVSDNYNINYVDNTSSVINKADLTVTATQTSKTYDGTTNAPGTGSVGVIAGAGAGESVNTAGSQAYLDKNAGSDKTVRASGVTIKDSGNADVSANYNINYVDNITSSIESILVGNDVPQPSLLVAQPLHTAFDPKSVFYVQPDLNASAINPSLVVPAALQKSIILKKKLPTECINTVDMKDQKPNASVKTCSE